MDFVLLAKKIESDVIAPYKFMAYNELDQSFKDEDGIFTLKFSETHINLFLYNNLVINYNIAYENLDSIPYRYLRKRVWRYVMQLSSNAENEKLASVYANIYDRLIYDTYSLPYLVKILNDGMCKKDQLKLTCSDDMADANEYNIYTDIRDDKQVAFEIMYHAETICVIESYGQLLEANELVKRGLIEYCNCKINTYEKRLNEMEQIKRSLS